MRIAKHKNYKIRVVKNKNGDKNIHVEMNGSLSLFRYRPINKYTTQQFLDDALFATVPSSFNDPYDATVRFSIQKIKRHIKKKLLENNLFLDHLLKINGLKKNQINELVEMIYKRDLSPNIYFGNNTYSLVCFSTDITQEIMWAHYADLATGFALEYDFQKLCEINYEHQSMIENMIKNTNIFDGYDFSNSRIENPLLPVIYTNEKYDVTDICIEYIDTVLQKIEKDGEYNPFSIVFEFLLNDANNRSDRLIQNVFYRKKIPWSYENEWRMICYNYNPLIGKLGNDFVDIGRIVPKAIYLGEKISKYNEDALVEMAKKKGIEVYKMKTSIVGSTLKLKPIRIIF